MVTGILHAIAMPFGKTWHLHSFPSDGCEELFAAALFYLPVVELNA